CIKTLSDSIDVNGDLTINGTAQLASGIYAMTLAGDWDVTSSNADPFVEGTGKVIFDGITNQLLTNSGDETFYDLQINKAIAKVIVDNFTDVTVSNSLGMLSGNLDLDNNLLMINGSATINGGSSVSYVQVDSTGSLRRKVTSTG
ncbi:MAG: hypothetical protein IH946_04250, partial [Bacteroidetes bacterium]|nr:hypothetical protein [Bacteroidota bacterium]